MLNICKAALVIGSITLFSVAAQQTSPLSSTAIIESTKAATAVILAGEGAGRLRAIATGVVISKDGILLTALHAVKGATEVQVRLANGEVFDRVELLGSDERRDVAALKIAGRSLPALEEGKTPVAQGDTIYAVTSAGGLAWSATQGIISALRPADEVPNAGTGYRLLQFNAAIASGSSGGALVDRNGRLVGIITRSTVSSGFAVPIESVLGLPESGQRVVLGSGASLQMPKTEAVQSAESKAALNGFEPALAIKNAKTVNLRSKTSFLTVATLTKALTAEKDWPKLGLTIVQDQRLADLWIEIDRPLFTYVHTFVLVDRKTSAVLGSGKVTALDGNLASKGLAKDIIKILAPSEATPPK